ncbi:UDP-N-acetylmuramate--L-alanine ligase [Alloscardovia omnicolens]|uniref:UDP-N-acetylmuramate--L-alanine ligase n=3 Tax=Alloscardovia omnicolens TaxID=419015 RepID=A0A2I1M637_9BIFI|nr:UDP-N-acetylmuramate--L-alanine ligase [Alloscardovia omnicolens]MDK6444618.1 UDP-N-acetylmuramate--L-alanine ligase [Alloscardovia omnicolens]MDK6521689.1 UDP-N-acetylmuramate--L-alanine ligase [Alloscardovia omnicolens]MDK6662929.1 UDP-N-acetylmuramate--L-alanine ligase [Alloscardovia omnicolens]MDK7747582.1 UDP-N-acetylmuramate--L-alanine ligase [Alloscardovia omnicolens]MDU6533363.1 UDP-N-acetylmuramate--L-alanine ligase [Alloscardovia omnicolens]
MEQIVLDPTHQPIDYSQVDITKWEHVHFIGIGGAGMSVLAEMLLEEGVSVSGSDAHRNAKTDKLESLGATIYEGQEAQNVDGASIVVYSSAIKPNNPEIVRAFEQGSLVMHRSDILATLMAHKTSITVAGAHGKTTTSAMIAQIFASAGRADLADPSYAIGGSIHTPEGLRDGGHAGHGSIFVAEADESDGSFLKYRPSLAVITNVEPDHLDHYGDAQAFAHAFIEHAQHAQQHVIACGDDEGALNVVRSLNDQERKRAIVYTTNPNLSLQYAQVVRIHTDNKSTFDGGQDFSIQWLERYGEEMLHAHIRVPGEHNVRNATAALIAALVAGVQPLDAVRALDDFRGAARRFDIKAVIQGVTVVDDYAHHPTEVNALMDAARVRYPHERIRVLFQPHLFSRTHFFADQFAHALAKADEAIVTGIFPARELEKDWPDISSQTIPDAAVGLHAQIRAIDDMNEAARYLADSAQSGDVIFTVGAGSITTMADSIAERLSEREVEQ